MLRNPFTQWSQIAGVLGLLPVALSCHDESPQTSPSGTRAPPAAKVVEWQHTRHAIGADSALDRVRGLAEMRSLILSQDREAKVVAPPADDAKCEGELLSSECSWQIAVAHQASWNSAGQLAAEAAADFMVRVDARSGAISMQSSGEDQFHPYATWKVRYHQRERAVAVILSTPEWQAESGWVKRARADREPAELGLLLDGEPPANCEPGTAECRWRFMALSICGGCAGHWQRFEFDAVHGTLFVEMLPPETSPYELWRNSIRIDMQGSRVPEYRELADPQQVFPRRDPKGEGPGYGKASVSDRDPLAMDPALQLVIAEGGYRLIRVERFGAAAFPVFALEAMSAAVTLDQGDRFREWCAALLRASGGRALELGFTSSPERYQVDQWVLKPTGGGIYAYRAGNFHPWTPHSSSLDRKNPH